MKRKTFAGEWGWAGFVALACVAFLIASQVYLEIIGDKSANVWTWLILGILTAAIALVMVSCYRYVRRHNAKVDRPERVEPLERFEVSDESDHDPGPYWHR